MRAIIFAGLAALALTGCADKDPRGVDHNETLLNISATGKAESQPDQARFSAGMSTIRRDAQDATKANAEAMQKLVDALAAEGIDEKDIQTQNVSVNRIDYGPNKGRFEANNQVSVRVRKVDSASAAIGAATASGANILNGPSLTQADPEAAKLSAYSTAYKAARAKADAYATAAGLKVSRILTIADADRGGPYNPYATADVAYETAPPPVSAPPVYGGTNIDTVSVTVQYALVPE